MRLTAIVLFALTAASCRNDAPGDTPRLAAGRTTCERCGMIVGEARFAGGWVAEDGSSVLFDDTGELLVALASQPERKATAWAGDFESGRWTRVSEAAFVRVPGFATPMGTGVIAFASEAAAVSFTKSHPGAMLIPQS